MKIAVAAKGETADSVIPGKFEEATHLLLIDGYTGAMIQILNLEAHHDAAQRSMVFANQVVEWDCEALLCGELEAAPFAVLAEENSVTRYMAAGIAADEALKKMNRYELYFLTDYVNGPGCGSGEDQPCRDHGDHA